VTISQRRDRLRQLLASAALDALLVSDLVNVRYLSGFTGSNAALLILTGSETPVLATDGRYRARPPSRHSVLRSSSSGRVLRIWSGERPKPVSANWDSKATW